MKLLMLMYLLAVLPVLKACKNVTLELNLLKQHVELLNNVLMLTNQRLTDVSEELKQNLTKANMGLDEKLIKGRQDLDQILTSAIITFAQNTTKANQALEQKLVQKDQGLTQKVARVSQDVQSLKAKEETVNGYCQTNSNRCGTSCYCVEDLNIPDKHYCDCRSKPVRRDCKEHYAQGERINGLYRINHNTYGTEVHVYCDQKTDGGGWTLIQRRVDGSINFFRNWQSYKHGFGQLHHEHWLGNDNIYLLTGQDFRTGSQIRFDLQRKDYGKRQYAKYSSFRIDNEANAFKLNIGGFSGDIGQDKMSWHNGMKWTTRDRDNDRWSEGNCAYNVNGAWWYNACETSNLNGIYDEISQEKTPDETFGWNPYRLEFSEMKVRRK